MSDSRLETALATLATNLAAISDCTVHRNLDAPLDWEDTATTPTTRAIILRDGGAVPKTRCMQTVWFLSPALELHVRGNDHTTLGPAMRALQVDVVAVLGADRTLGGVAVYCEPSEEEPSEAIINQATERGSAAELAMPLAIVIATSPTDLTAAA